MANGNGPTTLDDVVAAIQDLTRVTIAINGSFESKADAIRRLHELSIPANRIAAILAMEVKDVSSSILKYKKKAQRGNNAGINSSSTSSAAKEPTNA